MKGRIPVTELNHEACASIVEAVLSTLMVTSGPESVHSTVISTSTSKPPGQGTNGSEPSIGILAFSKS